jgi:DNA repair exonuclease SbcCD ATPase subunit
MKVISLKVENFLAIGEAHVRLDDRGLVLIQGENKDDASASSNGSGKSSLPDALCWALYGVTARGATGDAVVRIGEGKNCRVVVDLEDDGSIYRVERHRKHKVGKNGLRLMRLDDVTGEIHDLTQGTDALTQVRVSGIMGCSMEVFRSAVYAGQESFPDLPGMTDKQLKLLVEEGAGIDLLQSAYDVARGSLLKANEAELSHLKQIELLERMEAEATKAVGESERELKTWADNRDRRLVALEMALVNATDDVTSAAKRIWSDEVLARYRAELVKIREGIDGIERERERERALEKALNVSEAKLADAKARLSMLTGDLKRRSAEISAIESRVDTPCDECGKIYSAEDIAPARIAAKAQLLKLATQARTFQNEQVSAAVEGVAAAQKTLLDHQSHMTNPTATMKRREDLQVKLDHAHALEVLLDRAKHERMVASDRLAEAKVEKNPYEVTVVGAQRRLESATKAVKAAKEKAESLKEAREICAAVSEVFSPAGVRAHILDTVTPFLNERTAHYLGILSEGHIMATWSTLTRTAKGELREKFNIEVNNDSGANSFVGLSGGEKRKVRLATALALQDLVSSRATKPINIWIGDEVDHALDGAGLERLMTILSEKARERGTVLVISHNSLNEWISDVVTVRKEGGVSTVSGILS